MTVAELQTINGLKSSNLRLGQQLKVWGTAPPPPPRPVPPVPPPAPPPTAPSGDFRAARARYAVQSRPEGDFQRFSVTVPLLDGRVVTASMRNNVNMSRHMVYPEGLLYGGQSLMELDVATIQSVGLSGQQARALQWVSTHEGKFDAINGYDRGIFSYGFIQFVGALAHGSSLTRVLASMKTNAPTQFARIFRAVGIDVEGNVVSVLDDRGAALRGDDAYLYIQRNVALNGAFIAAGFDPALVREQLRMANALYVQPALNFQLTLSVGGLTIRIPRLQEILNSEAILTAVIAIAINQGTGGMSRIFSSAVSAVAMQSGLTNAQALQRIDQRQVCNVVASTTTDERIRNRAQGVLDSGLSFFA